MSASHSSLRVAQVKCDVFSDRGCRYNKRKEDLADKENNDVLQYLVIIKATKQSFDFFPDILVYNSGVVATHVIFLLFSPAPLHQKIWRIRKCWL